MVMILDSYGHKRVVNCYSGRRLFALAVAPLFEECLGALKKIFSMLDSTVMAL
jgi:hypothetical protein